ncbi:hypothetical protein WAI453_008450 [Rhynchosporium graminicola]
MGFFDSFSDLLEAALPWSTAEAEAPKEEEEKEDVKDASEESEESKDKPEEEAEEEEEEEEEEEDMVDPKEKLEEGKSERFFGYWTAFLLDGWKLLAAASVDKLHGMEMLRSSTRKRERILAGGLLDICRISTSECKSSKACSPAKHHFDECVERVTGAHEHSTDKKHPDEDCVEEFFHLAHCATACAAPKLWAVLK